MLCGVQSVPASAVRAASEVLRWYRLDRRDADRAVGGWAFEAKEFDRPAVEERLGGERVGHLVRLDVRPGRPEVQIVDGNRPYGPRSGADAIDLEPGRTIYIGR